MIPERARTEPRGRRRLRRFLRSRRAAAAAEFALILPLMIVPFLNVVDLGLYAFRRMQVDLAAEAGVQAVRASCGPMVYPVTQYCSTGLVTKITTAAQSTTLGDDVTLQSGTPIEGYYCVSSGQLTLASGSSTGTVGSPPTKPSNFAGACSGASPGDYVQVAVTYTFTPLFPSMTVASLLPSPITRTAWYRVA
jgi:Flp pilus assembly protein TadG